MPPANSWSDAIYPYIKNEGIFRCPSEPGRPGYAMNSNLNLLPMANVKSPAYTVLLFESTKGACNASDVGQSIAWRHSEGGNFAFVDGHVQWVHRGSPLNFDPTVASPPGITPAPIGPTTPLPP